MDKSQMENATMGYRIRRALPGVVAVLTAVFMLCVVPLYVHDGFFDINRAKVSLILTVMPYAAVIMGIALLQMPDKSEAFTAFPWMLLIPMGLFLAACFISCALRGFEEAVLTGNEGRYGGLFFILALTTACLIISLGRSKGIICIVLFLISSVVIAILGCANALGVDPMGFYENMREDQIPVFLSTIGHYDFYGSFLLLPAAVAYGISVKGSNLLFRILACLCGVVLTLGAYAARTDSVWLGMAMIGFSLLFLSGEDWLTVSRALLMDAIMVILFPAATYVMQTYSSHDLNFSGMYTVLTLPVAGEITAVFCILALLCRVIHHHDIQAPGYKRLAMIGLIIFLVVVLVTVGLVIYSTNTTREDSLFGLSSVLRMDDNFGTRRGYIWRRAIRAFIAAPPLEKCFGQGLELTRRITRPFIESVQEEQLGGGTYNDTHCQPLQMLITCGLFGMIAYLLHFFLFISAAGKRAESDALLSGITVAMAGYFVVMLINVSQPILLVAYFSLSGLGIGRIALVKQRQS